MSEDERRAIAALDERIAMLLAKYDALLAKQNRELDARIETVERKA